MEKKSLNNMTQVEKDYVTSQIQFNISEEAKASQFYFDLKRIVAPEDEKIIDEIIGDELDHAITLGRLQEKYSKIYPNSYEGLIDLKRKEGKM